MEPAEFSQNEPSLSDFSAGDDIPAALRDTPLPVKPPKRSRQGVLVVSLITVAVLSLIAGSAYFLTASSPRFAGSKQPPNTQSTAPVNPPASIPDAVLGHIPYAEAPPNELKPITADGRITLRQGAAENFQAMVAAARAAGVTLVPISGFRSIQEQERLFFDVKAQRNQTAAERAAVSAPPRYSEHHTGYAVDIGDGNVPATNLSPDFEKTKAFEWLQANAARFNFEMSFPKGNPQGVSYEPWHWRFVGDPASLETFYKARNLKPAQ